MKYIIFLFLSSCCFQNINGLYVINYEYQYIDTTLFNYYIDTTSNFSTSIKITDSSIHMFIKK